MKYLSETGLKHLIKKIRSEIRQRNNQTPSVENPYSWEEIRTILQNGEGPLFFSVGDQLVCNHTEFGPIVWDIIALDHEDADTITLQTHDLLPRYVFDQREAFFVTESDLAPGTYCMETPSDYRTEFGGGNTVVFTVQNTVPAGSLFVHVWYPNSLLSTSTVEIYHTPFDEQAAEVCRVSYGESENLLSQVRHLSYGSGNNRWQDSDLRKYLNDSAWAQSSLYDRAPMEIPPSFCAGLDADFLSVLMPMTKKENRVSDGGEDTFTDRFTIPSFGEVNGGAGPHPDDRVAYEYYGTDLPGTEDKACRIKLLNGAPCPYFLRSPSETDGMGKVYYVTETGRIDTAPAHQKFGIAPICCIS